MNLPRYFIILLAFLVGSVIIPLNSFSISHSVLISNLVRTHITNLDQHSFVFFSQLSNSFNLSCKFKPPNVSWLKNITELSYKNSNLEIKLINDEEYMCINLESLKCTQYSKWYLVKSHIIPSEFYLRLQFSNDTVSFLLNDSPRNPIPVTLYGEENPFKLMLDEKPVEKIYKWEHYNSYSISFNSSDKLKFCSPPGFPHINDFQFSDIGSSYIFIKLPFQTDYNTSCHDQNISATNFLKGPLISVFVKAHSKRRNYLENLNFTTTEFNFTNLSPYTEYTFDISIFNGYSTSPKVTKSVRTSPSLPGTPLINASEIQASSLKLSWSHNGNANGLIKSWRLENYYCDSNKSHSPLKQRDLNSSNFEFLWIHNKPIPDTCFTFFLYILNEIGISPIPAEINVTTDFEPPEEPILIEVKPLYSPNDQNHSFGISVTWRPSSKNLSEKQTHSLRYQLCIISNRADPIEQRLEKISLDAKMMWRKSEDFEMLRKKGVEPYEMNTFSDFYCTDLPESKTNQENNSMIFWSEINWDIFLPFKGPVLEFAMRSVTNQSIRQNRFFYSFLSNVKQLDLIKVGAPFDSSDSRILVVILISAVLLFLVFVLVIIVYYIRNCKPIHWYEQTNRSDINGGIGGALNEYGPNSICSKKIFVMQKFENSSHKPISVNELLEVVAKLHADGNLRFQKEFEDLDAATSMDWPSMTYKLPNNALKNRYSNVYPYDHTRVVLNQPPHGSKSNYINANFVDGFHRSNAYIATQGPLLNTLDDFWQMIWEQNTNIIVMTSQFVERVRRKCDQYWPDEGTHLYGNILVRMVSQHVLAYFIIRTFTIRNVRRKKGITSKERNIYHYQYTDWADFDVPKTPLPVLVFVRASVRHWRASDGPIVVHCSAGVGRTGTYICIESLIRQMDRDHTVNIRGFLEHIRQQRMKLVQTEAQYAFIHDALCEHLLCPLHEIPQSQFNAYVSTLRHSRSPTTGQSYLECQFQIITAGSFGRRIDPQYDFCTAQDNVRKNRCQQIIPLDCNRVNLSYDMTQGRSSNYINASVLLGYRRLDEFIVTQHPLQSTVGDFWRMVWEKNSPLIICFASKNSSDKLDDFWPLENNAVQEIGWLRIGFIRQGRLFGSVTSYEFLLSSTREDYALPCHLWRVTEWPNVKNGEIDDVPQSTLDFLCLASHLVQPRDSTVPPQSSGIGLGASAVQSISSAQNSILSVSMNQDPNISLINPLDSSSLSAAAQFLTDAANSHGPTILVDEFGASQGGIFCALVYLINQLVHDGTVDVYYIAKMLNIQRPGIWTSCDDFSQLYELVQLFIQNLNNNQYTHLLPLPHLNHHSFNASIRCKTNASPGENKRASQLLDARGGTQIVDASETQDNVRCLGSIAASPHGFLTKYRLPKANGIVSPSGSFRPLSKQEVVEHVSLQLLGNMLLPTEAAFTHHENNFLFISPPKLNEDCSAEAQIPSPPKEACPPIPADVSIERYSSVNSSHTTIASLGIEDEDSNQNDDLPLIEPIESVVRNGCSSISKRISNYINDNVDAAPVIEDFDLVHQNKGYGSPESQDGELSPGLTLDLPKNIIPAKDRIKIGLKGELNDKTSFSRASGLPHPNPTLNQMRKRPALSPFALYHLIMCIRETGRRLAMSDTTIARACTIMHRALSVLITGKDSTNPSSTGGSINLSTNLQLSTGIVDEIDIDFNDPELRRMISKEAINDSFVKSLSAVDPHTLGMACLSLAGKIQEEYQRMRDVILSYHRCLHQHDMSGQAPLEPTEDYDRLRDSLVQCELLLMRLLSFDARQPTLPHPYLLHYISALLHWIGKGTSEMPAGDTVSSDQMARYEALSRLPGLAWSLLADSYHIPLCLQFQPDHIAASILHLALRLAGVEVPGHRQSVMAWWEAVSNTLSCKIVEQIQWKVMNIYSIDDVMQSKQVPLNRRFE